MTPVNLWERSQDWPELLPCPQNRVDYRHTAMRETDMARKMDTLAKSRTMDTLTEAGFMGVISAVENLAETYPMPELEDMRSTTETDHARLMVTMFARLLETAHGQGYQTPEE